MMGSAVTAMTTGYAGPPCEIEVALNKIEGRKAVTMRDRNKQTSLKAPVFMVSNSNTLNLLLVGRRGRERHSFS